MLRPTLPRLQSVVRTVLTGRPPSWQATGVGEKPLPGPTGPLGKDLAVKKGKAPKGQITIPTQHGQLRTSRLWLRDACRCPKCVDPHSGQKNFSTTDLPDDPTIRSMDWLEDGSLKVIWHKDGVFGQDTHESIYPRAEIEKWRDQTSQSCSKLPTRRKHWNKATYSALLQNGVTKISYKDWTDTTDRAAFWRAFEALSQTGLIFLTDVPHGEQEVERIGDQIGTLQHTFYGMTWDVKSKPQAENVAYTSQFLGLHQDLMYHTPIPRLQILHCLENSCEGGESLFSDGLRAALQLRRVDRAAFDTLTSRSWYFGYDKAPHHYERRHSVIDIDKSSEYIVSLHWAPPFQSLFRPDRPGEPSLLKRKQAASKLEKILSSEHNMLEVKLNPGEAVIFDNWRVLHGRREFAAGSGGSRWLKGTYIAHQVFESLDARRPRSDNDPLVFPLPDNGRHRTILNYEEERQLARDDEQPQNPEEVGLEKWAYPGEAFSPELVAALYNYGNKGRQMGLKPPLAPWPRAVKASSSQPSNEPNKEYQLL